MRLLSGPGPTRAAPWKNRSGPGAGVSCLGARTYLAIQEGVRELAARALWRSPTAGWLGLVLLGYPGPPVAKLIGLSWARGACGSGWSAAVSLSAAMV